MLLRVLAVASALGVALGTWSPRDPADLDFCPPGQVPMIIDWEFYYKGNIPENPPGGASGGTDGLLCPGDEAKGIFSADLTFEDACVRLRTTRYRDGAVGAGMVFDTDNPTGDDFDLAQDDEGKVLIITEDFDSSDPDDDVHGGLFEFFFDEPGFRNFFKNVSIPQITLLDTDSQVGDITAIGMNGTIFQAQYPIIPNGAKQVIDFGATGVSKLEIDLQGSGAVSDIKLCLEEKDFDFCPEGQTAAIIDFDNLVRGFVPERPSPDGTDGLLCFTEAISSSNMAYGSDVCVRVKTRRNSDNMEGVGMVYDSTCTGGCSGTNRDDFFAPSEQNVFILSVDLNSNEPKVDGSGGDVEFFFDQALFNSLFSSVTVIEVTLLDTDFYEGDIIAFQSGGTTTEVVYPEIPDGFLNTIAVDAVGVERLFIEIRGTGGVSDIKLCLGPNDLCVDGLVSPCGDVCCPATCGICGGCNCSHRPGG